MLKFEPEMQVTEGDDCQLFKSQNIQSYDHVNTCKF